MPQSVAPGLFTFFYFRLIRCSKHPMAVLGGCSRFLETTQVHSVYSLRLHVAFVSVYIACILQLTDTLHRM